MDRTTSTLIVLLVILLVLALMVYGWRRRRRRQAWIPRPRTAPADPGRVSWQTDGLHVATTTAGDPWDRIAVRGLGFRARATVTVTDAGVVLGLRGEGEAFVPRDDLVGVDRASWTIDRAVERDGLVVVRWRLGEALLDSYLRVADSAALVAALSELAPVGVLDGQHPGGKP